MLHVFIYMCVCIHTQCVYIYFLITWCYLLNMLIKTLTNLIFCQHFSFVMLCVFTLEGWKLTVGTKSSDDDLFIYFASFDFN